VLLDSQAMRALVLGLHPRPGGPPGLARLARVAILALLAELRRK
jgi:hypothetical protein